MRSFKQFTFTKTPQIFNEASLGRVFQHTQGRNVGLVTAHRGEYTAPENIKRNKNLEEDIRKAGFGFIHVKGRYIENHGTVDARPVDEHSYLVVGSSGNDAGKLKGFLVKVGEKYSQDSVLYKSHDEETARLIGTKEGGFPGLGVKHDVGTWHPNRAGEFHSVMNGRTFAFESIQYLTPKSFSSREEVEF